MVEADQSLFAGSQSVLQAPPPEIPQPPVNQRTKQYLFLGVGGFIILVLLMILLTPRKVIQTPVPSSSPSPLPSSTVTEMEQQLLDNDATVKQANPDDVIVLPPEVDMKVTF